MLIPQALAHGGVGTESEGAGGTALLVILAVALVSFLAFSRWKKWRKRTLESAGSDKIHDL